MAYSQSQLRCLAGMGLVPWVLRDSPQAAAQLSDNHAENTDAETLVAVLTQTHEAPAVEIPAVTAPVSQISNTLTDIDVLLQTPLIAIPFRGRPCTQLGNPDASLLILVEAVSTQQKQYPFEPADARVFEDMLRAIAWRRQDVCLAVLPPTNNASLITEEQGNTVADLCRAPRDAVLFFRQQLPRSLHPDELILPVGEKTGRDTMACWQLPHPALLRESPDRKRQAWEVLKAARSKLG